MKKKSLIVQCSDICPCVCPGCYNFLSSSPQISVAELDAFITAYNNLFSLDKVTLSGGDPLLRKDIVSVIKIFLQKRISISIDTVGLTLLGQIDEDLISALSEVKLLGVPLDGMSDNSINHFRIGMTLGQTLEILRIAQIIMPSVCVNTVVTPFNLDELKNIALFLNDQLCITKWQVFQFMPIGPRGYKNKKIFSVSDVDYFRKKEEILNLSLRESLIVDFKSIQDRVNQYLMVGCDGVVWTPKLSKDRHVLGSIKDSNIFEIINNNYK